MLSIIHSNVHNLLGCMYNSVRIEFDQSTSTISCIFTQQNSAEKSCNVTYCDCNQRQGITATSSLTRSDTVTAQLDIGNLSQKLCFTATIMNGNFTVEVIGEFGKL